MSFQYSLQKILEVKKMEKDTVEGEYQKATEKFEEIATSLYELLKRKEQIEENYYQRMGTGLIIAELQQTQVTISQLQTKIDQVQQITQQARNQMNLKQELLLEKTIELKKYEKMKEIKYEQFIEDMKKEENKQMDEISVQQFMNR